MTAIKYNIKALFEKITGRHIYKYLPFGMSFTSDIKKNFPGYKPKVILDIGANIGMSALELTTAFPTASIHSFEPARETFEILKAKTRHLQNVKTYQLAVGNSESSGYLIKGETSDINKVKAIDNDPDISLGDDQEIIQFISLEKFSRNNHIDQIHFLKIDTEGFDLDVLKSGIKMISENRIDFIQVEAAMNPTNKDHVQFHEFLQFFSEYNYSLFGIYEQVLEWKHQKKLLRRSNPVFISNNLT